MFSPLVEFLENTVDSGYLEMFCSHVTYKKKVYTWVKDDCANAVILRHSSALFPWEGCASKGLVSQPTAQAMLCSSFDREINTFVGPGVNHY